MAFEIEDTDPPASSGRFVIEDSEPEASAPAPADNKRKPGRVQRALIGAIPFVGPMLRDTDLTTLLPGAVSGMSTIGQSIGRGGVGATAIDADAPGAYLAPAQNVRRGGVSPAEQAVADRQRSIAEFDKGYEGDVPFQVAKVATPIAATMPLGPLIGRAVTAAAPTRLGALGEAIGSGGFKLGASAPANPVAVQALRATGGAINAGAQSAVIDPENMGKSALIGAAMPGGVRVAEKVGTAAAQGLRRAFPGRDVAAANRIMTIGGFKPGDVDALRQRLAPMGPKLVDDTPTVPQILGDNPGLSQLQRNLIDRGDSNTLRAAQASDAARTEALGRLGRIADDLPEARDNFGRVFDPAYRQNRAVQRAENSLEFEAIDPQNVDVRQLLPIDKFRMAREKFMGSGTVRPASSVSDVIRTAEDIGTQELPAITAAKAPKRGADGLDLFEAMKRLGGIKQDSAGGKAFAGELQAMKQSGARGVIQNGRGQSPDTIAEAMHAQGYLPDADPDTLFAAMRQHGMGDKVYAVSAGRGRAGSAGIEANMGDAPGAERIPVPVNWSQLQKLRSSIGSLVRKAQAKPGNEAEIAALSTMKGELDAAVNRTASGQGEAAEFFPPERVKAWREAVANHARIKDTFDTGPQARLLHANGPSQGEMAGMFFNRTAGQSDDIANFSKVRRALDPVRGQESEDALKTFALTDLNRLRIKGSGQLDSPLLSPAKVDDWLTGHAGAVRGLFDDTGQSTLEHVRRGLVRDMRSDALNVAKGSATAQNIETALGNGLLDNSKVRAVIGRIPKVGRLADAGLGALSGVLTKSKAEQMGRLLADPIELERALAKAQRGGAPLTLGTSGRAAPLAYRALPLLGGPLLSSDQ